MNSEMDLKHCSHDHPLLFMQEWRNETEEEEDDDDEGEARCSACEEGVEGPSYYCNDCKFYLHKTCAELVSSSEVSHPIHPSHPLILKLESPNHRCNLCRENIRGYRYHCALCDFDLDIKCASVRGNFGELQHLSHEHPFMFIENHDSIIGANCLGCGEEISSSSCYKCLNCLEVYLHKTCVELVSSLEVSHPIHPPHPLILELKSPHHRCNLCRKKIKGYRYHCAPCDFDLDIKCASVRGNFDKLHHLSHEHPFIFIENHDKSIKASCLGCLEKISSSSCYKCLDCLEVYLHKTCAELVSSLEVSHPIHPPHPLILELESPHHECNLCRKKIRGYRYHCALCDFDLDIKCASVRGNFGELQHPSHEHPFIFIDNHDMIIRADCLGCGEEISSSSCYKCLDCLEVYLHKKCADLPLQIDIFHHHRHLLLQKPPIHSESCSCYLCKIQWKGFVYGCHVCEFFLAPEEVLSLPDKITSEKHEHPWTLFAKQMSFICDFCGTDGDRTPYLCTTCNFIVHKNCISLPSTIIITRHHHRLSHSYSLPRNQFEEWKCKICYKEVNKEYGSYYCPASNCNYIAHVNCATNSSIWDPNHEDEWSEGESMNWITDVIQRKCLSGDETTTDETATEIKHAFHDHNLILTFSGEVKDDSNCDGCMRPISTPFYGCKQCEFSLHKTCAELPREKRHASHKHLLALSKDEIDDFLQCSTCERGHHGFSYKCKTPDCFFEIDVQCSLLSDTLRHPSHEHLLFLDHNCQENCNGCEDEIRTSFGYKCTQGCDKFILDFWCLTQPQIGWYKYDKHPLNLTYDAGSDPDQYYCDICENERDPHRWFYYCAHCDNSAHLRCVLGELPFIKLGRTYKGYHQLTFVKNIWNCPPCIFCEELCYGQALQCTKCNFNVHWRCI